MKVVVFTCSTGSGHNACARYIKQEFDDFGITCDIQDYLKLVGDNAAKIIEKLYLDSTKGNGNIFGGVYKLGELYSKTNIPSPVYGLNVLVKEKLDKFLTENNYDLAIGTHLFPCLALTKLKTDSNNKLYFELDNKRYYKEGEELNNALDGDIIAVTRKGKHIVKIIERTKEELILEVVEIDGVKQLEPILLPGKGKIKARISSNDMKHLNIGDRIKARISLEETDGVYEADYISTIGNIKDNDIDMISIVTKHGFNIEFSEEALKEARDIPQTININDYKNRYDFTKRFKTFTIDCDNTKDIDDAVSITKNENGNYVLAVHIAHVSHYVKRGSALNKEAYERALSAYPANSVIPMLPKELSNGICSLNPNTKRLTRTCIMEISPRGELLNYNFANSINCYNVYAYSIAYDENREPSDYETYYACACSRRDIFKYVHTLNEILEKYRNSVCFYGTYPLAIRDDMGDSFVFAKFKTLDELFEFDNFVREKAE